MLVQWNWSVGATSLFGVTVLEKNLSILQRPQATESRVFHWSPYELVSARRSERDQKNLLLSKDLLVFELNIQVVITFVQIQKFCPHWPESCHFQSSWSISHQSLQWSGSHWDTRLSSCPPQPTEPVHNHTDWMLVLFLHSTGCHTGNFFKTR